MTAIDAPPRHASSILLRVPTPPRLLSILRAPGVRVAGVAAAAALCTLTLPVVGVDQSSASAQSCWYSCSGNGSDDDSREIHQDRQEIRRDRNEIREDQQEIRQDIRNGDYQELREDLHELHEDRADLADDQRDLRHDQRDANQDDHRDSARRHGH